MEIVHTIKDLQAGLSALRAQGKKVGLVPTMGALHAGHASLVKRCVAENDAAVVSVFVNPTQFNDKNDLEKYPRTLDADCALLEACGAAFVFAPSVAEMYPEPDTRQFSYAPLDTVMEGAFRGRLICLSLQLFEIFFRFDDLPLKSIIFQELFDILKL